MTNAPWLRYLIPALVVAVVLFLRVRGARRATRLRLERLWIVPVLYLALTVLLFVTTPPPASGWLWAALACAVGAALGWQRGRSMRIAVDPETHELSQQGSAMTLVFLLALIALRVGLRSAAAAGDPAWHVDTALITDCLVALALGMFSVQRLEMYLRGRRLLGEARVIGASH